MPVGLQRHSASSKIRVFSSKKKRQASPSSSSSTHWVLGPQGIRDKRQQHANRFKARIAAMGRDEREELATLRDNPKDDSQWDDETTHSDHFAIQDILDGTDHIPVSHTGDEFQQIIEEEIKRSKHRPDPRTCRDATENRNQGFKAQLTPMVAAYMCWSEALGDGGLEAGLPLPASEGVEGLYNIQVVDVFKTYSFNAELLLGDAGVAAGLIRQGLIPCAPYKPTLAFTTRTVELYRAQHLRCPHLSAQSFVKGLCDIHGNPFRPYLGEQFSICYDLYISLRHETRQLVISALGRDKPYWRLRNTCPACSYSLKGEPELIHKMLITMDGNDSLKRILRRERAPADERDGGEPLLGESRERMNTREAGGDYYITRERVDLWAKEVLASRIGPIADVEGLDESPCESRWKNMMTEITQKMWGVFDETGIFLALCRHGFVLVIADMIRSGELAKYGLAVVDILLEAFGDGLGVGYDIGCKFGVTVNNSTLGERARSLNYHSLVGSFHGHAHNRLCQLSYLTNYVKGIGLEDLEGCERFFSKSNALAPSTRYASAFHRKQKIVEYMRYIDTFETYQNLSTFLVNNYHQALNILRTEPALKKAMQDQGIPNTSVFSSWLEEERAYLHGLKKEPLEETLEMEYYQKLVDLAASEALLQKATAPWVVITPDTHNQRDYTIINETHRRHALKNRDKDQKAVQDLEIRLGIMERWTPGHPKWKEASIMVGKRRYQRCLDTLEGLVVAQMFELTKMNMSQTGYSLRKHIAKALQSRSQAIRSALERFNASADKMVPPRRHLNWNEVVEYAFLAEFDLLRESRQDVRDRPWATPAGRHTLDMFFKIERAREEIERLNIEIRRVITYIRDEEQTLLFHEARLRPTNPALAHQVRLYRNERGRSNARHMRRFAALSKEQGFTGIVQAGTTIDSDNTMELDLVDNSLVNITNDVVGAQADAEDEAAEDEGEAIELCTNMLNLISISTD